MNTISRGWIQTAPSLSEFKVGIGGLGVKSHQNFGSFAAGGVAVFVDPDGIPGRQSRNIGRENIFAVDGDAHLEKRPDNGGVGSLAAGAVDRRDDNRKIVDDLMFVLGAELLLGSFNSNAHKVLSTSL